MSLAMLLFSVMELFVSWERRKISVWLQVGDSSLIWNTQLIEAMELHNMLINALQIVISAELRKESRGAHYRDDFVVIIYVKTLKIEKES